MDAKIPYNGEDIVYLLVKEKCIGEKIVFSGDWPVVDRMSTTCHTKHWLNQRQFHEQPVVNKINDYAIIDNSMTELHRK